ncbi:hypothetical protein O181_009543 [Austropuccinia psidii MF-1]|uniref:Retroviral polymerase SH3-like domain-containing protein n=1 Tax=Austropuccinia psidii MF-1 TaxID=1389203 RepID=A0A9Q3BRJ4_9BASI|nr:hypothetical protein [Austropuccinia psidii MF-1]
MWKLSSLGEKGILIGYDNTNMSYHILKLGDGKVYTSRDFVFSEKEFPVLESSKESDSLISFESGNIFYIEEVYHLIDFSEDTEEEIHRRTLDPSSEESTDEVTDVPPVKRIEVVGPRHSNLTNSEISQEKIFPYSQKPEAHLAESVDPLSYSQTVSSSDKGL